MKDLKNDIAVSVAFNSQTINTDTTTDGVAVDLQDYEGCTFVFSIGTVTDGTYTPVVEESDTGAFSGEESAVADGDLIGTEANAALSASNTVKTLGYRGAKRYVRFTVTSASTSSGATSVHALAVLSHPLVKKDVTNEDAG